MPIKKPTILFVLILCITMLTSIGCAEAPIKPSNKAILKETAEYGRTNESMYGPSKNSKFLNTMKARVSMFTNSTRFRWMDAGKELYRTKFIKAGMVEHFVEVENGTIHFWTGGQGEPLVMLHGFGAEAVFQYNKQVKPFAKEYFLVIPDLLWIGESCSEKEDYSIDFMSQAIHQLLESQKIKRYNLLGLSQGGMVATMLAINYPDHIKKLVIVDSPVAPYLLTDEETHQMLETIKYDPVNLLIPKTVDDVRFLMSFGYHKPARVPSFVLKDTLRYMRTNLKKRIGMARYIGDNTFNLFGNSGYNITQKTLVVGAQYGFLPKEAVERLAHTIGTNATFKIVKNSAHHIPDDQPKEFNRIVLNFLKNSFIIASPQILSPPKKMNIRTKM
jgi:pimeloyl-ACP methyl ester carboxylesterase